MKNHRVIIVGIITVLILGTVFGVAAAPTFGEITLDPTNPTALSTTTISIDVSDDTPSEVRVTIEECNGITGVCYPDIQNVSMPLVRIGHYEVDVTLKHADATYITCQVVALSNGVWEKSSVKKVNLSATPTPPDPKKTPGFELLVVFAALGIGVFLLGRKRFQ